MEFHDTVTISENPLQGKIQRVKHPALPATCVVCHKSADGVVDFLDFQFDLDWYGAVVICETCACEMLTILDFAPVASLKETLHNNVELRIENNRLREENERCQNALDAVLRVRPDLSSANNVDSPSSDETNKSSDEPESRPSKPRAKRGLENVSQSKF